MAGKKENLKALFSNTRTRVMIIFTTIVLMIMVVVGIVKLRSGAVIEQQSNSSISNPGNISSIPGGMEPTEQYAHLVEQQNKSQAKAAMETGGSAIPTIIRSQALGQGAQSIGPQHGEGGVGFKTLAQENDLGGQRGLWLDSLKDSSCSKATVVKIVSEGATINDLKAGCSCAQLRDNGYLLKELQPVCSCTELRAAGFNARQFKEAGYSAGQLRQCNFSACELHNAGFTAQEMKDGGFSDGELKGAGFSDNEIAKASGLPEGITEENVRSAGCDASALRQLRAQGVQASAIRRMNGCTPAQLKAAGYTAQELKNAGFTAAELQRAGFTPEELKNAGFTARDLLNAGVSPDDLKRLGFTPDDISSAENELPPGITSNDVKAAGCDVEALTKERLAGVSAKLIKQYAGCSAQALKAAGFTDENLARAGFTPEQIAAAENTLPQGFTPDSVKAAGCDVEALKKERMAGVSAKLIKQYAGCNAQALKAAGFSDEQLSHAGFSPEDIKQANVQAAALGKLTDCSVASLQSAKAAGISAAMIRQTLGCSAAAMKAAGYTAKDLRDAGFTAAELKNAGFDAAALKNAGFSAKALRDAGFNASDLKNAGFSAQALKEAGFTASDLKKAGFSAKNLKDAGFQPDQLRAAGYSNAELKNAGFPGSDVAGLKERTENESPLAPVASGIPSVEGGGQAMGKKESENTKQLQALLAKQNQQMADQRYLQKIQQRQSQMTGTANQFLQAWQKVSLQSYNAGTPPKKKESSPGQAGLPGQPGRAALPAGGQEYGQPNQRAIIKTGDVMYAVLDTSVNSDEPSPILATIVSGKLKGSKLIGNFNLPNNSDKMIISFNTLSVPGAAKTTSISAYAIDPNTARTALSGKVNHHYLLRYGSLFASSFLEGFGNAFQSANTTVTVGGTGGGDNITVQNGVGRSALENAVIGLATVGKNWGQFAQQNFSTPTTVEISAGTGLGILFTQDITSIT